MNIHELLEHRHSVYLKWDEKLPGRTACGRDIACYSIVRLLVHDAINWQRHENTRGYLSDSDRPTTPATDAALLLQFIEEHDAEVETP